MLVTSATSAGKQVLDQILALTLLPERVTLDNLFDLSDAQILPMQNANNITYVTEL